MRVSVFMAIEFPFTLPNPNTPPAVMRWMDGWREGWMKGLTLTKDAWLELWSG